MDKDHILDEIRRTARANGGRPLGQQRFAAETGIREKDWLGRHWARWGDAVQEAGLTRNLLNPAYPRDHLLRHFAQLSIELGRLPASGDLQYKQARDSSFPSLSTFRRWGTKAEVVAKLREYCRVTPAFADVVQMADDYLSRHSRQSKAVEGKGEEGFVYLLKSGRYYKIGRSLATGRREYEIALQLPEPSKLLHRIRTDDPVGIEGYWHRRFEAKHKNGEWFDLNATDVAVFKRRKFM